MRKVRRERVGELDVVITGGTDGVGGGDGPLVVLLHGFGAPGTDLVGLAPMLKIPPQMRFAFPAAPLSLAGPDLGFGAMGMMDARAWWLIDIERLQGQLMTGQFERLATEVPDGLMAARSKIETTLDELERGLRVPPGQTVLGGFSQGAMLSTDVMLRGRRKLAGVVIWSGTVIAEGEWRPLLSSSQGLPILQSHGVMDPILPFESAERLRSHLDGAGAKLDFVAFRGGHEIPDLVLSKTSAFLQRVLMA